MSKGTVSQELYFAILPVEVIYHPDLKASDIRVYATLSERAGKKRKSWPGYRKIADDVHMSPTTVQESVARLEACGVVEIDRMKGKSNHYWLPSGGVTKSDTPVHGRVSETGTPVYQKPAQGVSETDTELDQITRPIELHTPQPPAEGPPEGASGRRGGSGRSETSQPETAAGSDELPAIRWARRWAELRNVTFTATVQRSWAAQVQEFIRAGGTPTEELLQRAVREGIREPKAWAYVTASVAESSRSKEINDWMADR